MRGQNISDQLERNGFALVEDLLDQEALAQAAEALEEFNSGPSANRRGGSAYGVRDLLAAIPRLAYLADHLGVRRVVRAITGDGARVVRSIFFDKTPDANWRVAWHQDLTIAAREKLQIEGFTAWSVKAGVPHVQPPTRVLENILTVRIHLDDTDASNGALKVIPGSHCYGRLDESSMRALIDSAEPTICNVARGGVLLMRPLLLHASSAGTNPAHRRVIHLEFSAQSLPGGLEWAR
ncbi:MAG: phytanoyl-CoA dioxygenase family protein [Pyrinomonadaceae bacterium]